MTVVNIHEAKTHLSRLLQQVEQGDEVILARAGRPVARLVRYDEPLPGQRVFGRDRGLFEVPENFDDPLPDEVLRGFLP